MYLQIALNPFLERLNKQTVISVFRSIRINTYLWTVFCKQHVKVWYSISGCLVPSYLINSLYIQNQQWIGKNPTMFNCISFIYQQTWTRLLAWSNKRLQQSLKADEPTNGPGIISQKQETTMFRQQSTTSGVWNWSLIHTISLHFGP
jgi:hypothetical protein